MRKRQSAQGVGKYMWRRAHEVWKRDQNAGKVRFTLPQSLRAVHGMQVGEVVKARVISADPASRRLSLSLVPAKQAALAVPADGAQTDAPAPGPTKASSRPVKVTKGATDNGAAIDPLGGLQPGDIVQGQIVQQHTQVTSGCVAGDLCQWGLYISLYM